MENRIVLSGGLGNQIFQYVAGRALFGDSRIILDYSLLKPKLLRNELPELSEFALSQDVVWDCPRRSLFKRKIAELILKGSSIREDTSYKRRSLIRIFPGFKSIVSIFLFNGAHIATPRGIGFSKISISQKKSNLLIGNFHSYKWFDKNPSKFQAELSLKNKSDKFNSYINLAAKENPLIIQMRFGDFLEISELNVITPDYFRNALAIQAHLLSNSSIWIFSNDFRKAREMLGELPTSRTREVNPQDFSSAEILELLKLGRGYIISNSTFGWWGAYLGVHTHASTCVPSKWYSTMMPPKDLIPATWHKIPTGHKFES